MKISTFKLAMAVTCASAVLSGCATTVYDTNHRAEIRTNIYSNSVANVEIGEKITGTGCLSQFPGSGILALFGGEQKFLEAHGISDRGVAGRAKAVAAYNALNGGRGLTTDIIVQPTWEVTQKTTIIIRDTCATVLGYRGVIRGFRNVDGPPAYAPQTYAPQAHAPSGQASVMEGPPHLRPAGEPIGVCTPDKQDYARRIGVPCSALSSKYVIDGR